jgi:hypothetical protein
MAHVCSHGFGLHFCSLLAVVPLTSKTADVVRASVLVPCLGASSRYAMVRQAAICFSPCCATYMCHHTAGDTSYQLVGQVLVLIMHGNGSRGARCGNGRAVSL